MMRRIRALETQIAEMDQNRKTMRASRDRSGICEVGRQHGRNMPTRRSYGQKMRKSEILREISLVFKRKTY
jgi:hypothetical protein